MTANAERGGGQARGYLKKLLPRFACHPATGELDGVGLKRFPEQVPRPEEGDPAVRAACRLAEPDFAGGTAADLELAGRMLPSSFYSAATRSSVCLTT